MNPACPSAITDSREIGFSAIGSQWLQHYNFIYFYNSIATRNRYINDMSNFTYVVVGASLASFLATGGYALIPRAWYDPTCNIKGNISYSGGQRIYHVPGQNYYWETRISYTKGERHFCSEQDARAAGWRKAGG